MHFQRQYAITISADPALLYSERLEQIVKQLRVLLINIPSRRGPSGRWIPLGAMAVASIVERAGHEPRFFDLYNESLDGEIDYSIIKSIIDEFDPDIIGFTGIGTSYSQAKELSIMIRNDCPEIILIAGGALASTYELLLTYTAIDVVFHGETENSLAQFLEQIVAQTSISDIRGISYCYNENIIRTEPVVQIKDLDTIPFPAYHIVDNLETYFENSLNEFMEKILIAPIIQGSMRYVSKLLKKNQSTINKMTDRNIQTIPIMTSRGCTHKCTFCYRHVDGIRNHSPKYVLDHIQFLRKNYGIEGIRFADELFGSRRKNAVQIVEAIRDSGQGMIFEILGARCDKVDRELLELYWECGATLIDFGQESGSDKILTEYGKGVNRDQNILVTKLTNEIGLANTVQLVVGSPSETISTIYETISFLRETEAYGISLNYIIPLPETPIWEYCLENGDIVNQETWLELVAEYGGNAPLLNLTKESDIVWRYFGRIILTELRMYYRWKTVKHLMLPRGLKEFQFGWLAEALFAARRSVAVAVAGCLRIIRPPTRGPRYRPGGRVRVRHAMSRVGIFASRKTSRNWLAREYPTRENVECQHRSLIIEKRSSAVGENVAIKLTSPRHASPNSY